MEVHHHPDLHHKEKKFKEYFLEFLMIFLAVTMGFFAESIRQHFVEKRITHQYLESLSEELIHNKYLFQHYDSTYKLRIPTTDSLINMFIEKKENQNLTTMARLTGNAKIAFLAAIDKSAYEEMVNSGGLKNLDNIPLKDSLSIYAGLIKEFELYNSNIDNFRASAFPDVTGLEDWHDIPNRTPGHIQVILPYPKFSELQRREITNFYSVYKLRYEVNIRFIKNLNEINEHLIDLVQNELIK